MRSRGAEPLAGDVGAAGILLAPYALLSIALTLAAPASTEQMRAADALVQLADSLGGVWVLVPFTLVIIFALALAIRFGFWGVAICFRPTIVCG